MTETPRHTFTIAKQPFELRRDSLEKAVRGVLPEPVASHYVVIGNRRYPPKQVIGLVTRLDRADFTSHQARRILMGLGFAVGRRVPTPSGRGSANVPGVSSHAAVRTSHSGPRPAGDERELSETLMLFRGEWVATKGDELLVAAPTPKELVGWLARHGKRADSMFRVPEDELALGGLAPL